MSTKVGRRLVDPDGVGPVSDEGFFCADRQVRVLDYSGDGVRRSLEESLQRMGLDRIDEAYIHDPANYMDQAIDEAYPALHELPAAGAVTHIRAGMNATAPLVRLVRETEADMIMAAASRCSTASPRTSCCRYASTGICAAYDVPLRAAAVQFPLRHPAVVSVAVGARSGAQVRDNVAMLTSPSPARCGPSSPLRRSLGRACSGSLRAALAGGGRA